MCKIQKNLYKEQPLFTIHNFNQQRLDSLLYNPLLFNKIIDNNLINKYILNNYNWKKSYEFWQICLFNEEPSISLYDFIKVDLYNNYMDLLKNIALSPSEEDMLIIMKNINCSDN